ncbi:MAG TPA: PA0069 family radical SAM protein [Burkholderiales bacterium]|nr:PA0069 family radical SAM protein [Burkholderiales bacterium]
MSHKLTNPPRGRGATFNPEGRFSAEAREAFDDGWGDLPEEPRQVPTTVSAETARSIISRNDSPDIPFTQSINPYRGCEHGCIYCYARPSHAYLSLSPGLDFETRLTAKVNAAELLRAELARPGYRCEPIALGANTDPYQPAEREWRITREVLEVLSECEHPLTITTKSALVERDLDLLAPMAEKRLARVYLSVATLDHELARKLEPRASAPRRRIEAIRRLALAGVPTGVFASPMIPALTDAQLETVLETAREAGAEDAGYTLLRLPHEVGELFKAWLERHYPLKAGHVMSLVRQMRGGAENDPAFGTRMRGEGVFADLLAQRFRVACERLGLNRDRRPGLNCGCFRRPASAGQLGLF